MAKREAAPSDDFETLYSHLEEKARRLEQGNLGLEESLKLYEEGAALVDRMREMLGGAELRMRTVQRRYEAEDRELREVQSEYGEGEE